jgi:ankyrin repeat protein
LIQVATIEKFLPFHATCSQGHLDVLKLLLSFPLTSLERVYFDSHGNRYLSPFDLNSSDVNEQGGLFAAVLTNRYHICQYLLDLKYKKLTDAECATFDIKKRRNSSLTTSKSIVNDLGNQQQHQQQNQNSSFFDQLKSVFLDSKSYDPSYIINYTSNPFDVDEIENKSNNNDNSVEKIVEKSLVIDENDNANNEQVEYFNPFNINSYSKFGTTCLHEAIRSRNYDMVDLLISKGADPNQQVFDFTQTNSITQQSKPISNCLCEAIKLKVKFH